MRNIFILKLHWEYYLNVRKEGKFMSKWLGVSLPIEMLDKIDAIYKNFSYTSRADFVKDAVRIHLKKCKRGQT